VRVYESREPSSPARAGRRPGPRTHQRRL